MPHHQTLKGPLKVFISQCVCIYKQHSSDFDSPGTSGKKFSKPIEEMSKQLNDCLKSFYTSARKVDSYYKIFPMKSLAVMDLFLRSSSHCKKFSIMGDPALTKVNQVLNAFVKDLRKTGKKLVWYTRSLSPKTNPATVRMWRTWSANSTNPAHLQRTVWFCFVLYFDDLDVTTSARWNQMCLYSEKRNKVKSVANSTEKWLFRCHPRGTIRADSEMRRKTIQTESYMPWKIPRHVELSYLSPACGFLFQQQRDSQSKKFRSSASDSRYCNVSPRGVICRGNLSD